MIPTLKCARFSFIAHLLLKYIPNWPSRRLSSSTASPIRAATRAGWMLSLISVFVLSACVDVALIPDAARTSTPDGSNAGTSITIDPRNRLLILGTDGNIYTVAPDGTTPLAHTRNASTRRQYLQPTWSPNGEQIAWSEVIQSGDDIANRLVISDLSGVDRQQQELPFAPFYFYWSPNGEKLAFLSNWIAGNSPTIALRLYDLAAEDEPSRTLAQGQPLYFSWHPTDSRILTHIGEERVEIQATEIMTQDGTADLEEGAIQTIAATAAGFPAPQWTPSGEEIIFATAAEGRRRLVIENVASGAGQNVTAYSDRIAFHLSPDGNRLAYALSPANATSSALGELYVYDLESRSTRELTTVPVLAFFWSPDGEKLAYLATAPVEGPDGLLLRLRWHVWDGADTTAYDTILPSRTFLQSYLTFFDQYARSMSIWSPDSDAFAYAGINMENRSGIWVQPLDEATPRRVAPGVFVAWSPR